jgi:amidase
MNIDAYLSQDATGLALAIKQNEANFHDLLSLACERADQVNRKINAITHQFPQLAERFIMQLKGDEPFYGVPIVVKELGQAIPGLPMRCGSRLLADNLAQYQHDFIGKILALGFVPFAMTNTPEFGLSYVTESQLFGPCRNPYDLTRSAGGSSGGSAAAVASGIVPVATASDGGGSIRIPAACCGLVGFKPSSGMMPTGPISYDPWSGMAVNNIVSRTLRDTIRIFEFFHPPLNKEKKADKPTFVLGKGLFNDVPIFPPFQEAFLSFIDKLNQANYTVVERAFHLPLQEIGETVLTLIKANISAEMQRIEKTTGKAITSDLLEPATWAFYEGGKKLSAADLILARDSLFQLLRPVREGLSDNEVIISPVLAQPPLPLGQLSTSDHFDTYIEQHLLFCPFTGLFNQTGMPAISLPYSMAGGFNFSVQLGARKGNDHALLKAANRLLAEGIITERAPIFPGSGK